MRWHYRDPPLMWLLPLAYVFHLAEEWFGGLPEWFARIIGAPLPRIAFVVINAVALAAMILATRAATKRESNGWMGIAIATLVFANALLHLLGSIVTGSYSPGLVTGVVFYLPLGLLVLMRAWSQAEGAMFRQGVVAGLALHALVIAIVFGVRS